MAKKKLGIIQSRGLGDIIIALPIAHYYYEQDWTIYWPVCEPWVEQLSNVAPYVNWVPITPDHGPFFYDIPMQRLRSLKCKEIICLYQALSSHPEFTGEPWFQHTSFDQYKYIRAGVPFKHKWNLKNCITRNTQRELDLFDRTITTTQPYVVTHLTSSQQTVKFDPSIIPNDWNVIPITDQGWVFDWLTVIERAEAVIMTDSSMANLVDQLEINVDKYFIPQHHIGLTPVHGCDWHWLPNPDLKTSAKIFRGA